MAMCFAAILAARLAARACRCFSVGIFLSYLAGGSYSVRQFVHFTRPSSCYARMVALPLAASSSIRVVRMFVLFCVRHSTWIRACFRSESKTKYGARGIFSTAVHF
jgi:hypothetical protein